jgi:hypothetical protein
MKIIINEPKIKKLGKIGTILRWTSIVLLVVALFAVFTPKLINSQSAISIYFGVLIVGVFLSSISNYLTSRYGKSPRPDELIDKSLKGLDDKYTIYHYKHSIPHLLVGPIGVWTLIPTFVDGEIIFDENKKIWIRKSGSFLNRFLSREAFGRPDKELNDHKKEFSKFLKAQGISENLQINAAVILLNKKCSIISPIQENEINILPYEKAKDKFRKLAKTPISLSTEVVNALSELEH